MGQWLTPDGSGGIEICRHFRFRVELAEYITGVLQTLTIPGRWEQFGDMSPQEMAEIATEALNAWCDSEDVCMIGQLWFGITDTVPGAVLLFDGVQRNRVDYPLLYAALDPVFQDDADHFTLPEAAGRALVIAGQGTGLTERLVGDKFGAETHTLDITEIPVHSHTYDKITATFVDPGASPSIIGIDDINTENTGDAGGGGAHNNLQPSFAIKVGVWAL